MVAAAVKSHVIAVVDDDPTFRDLSCAIVATRPDFTPVAVESGDALLSLLDRRSVSCVLLDYDLGGETGLAVKERLDRQVAEAPPVIMLTGDGRERTVIEAFRLGVDDYLPKAGLDPRQLLATIEAVLAKSQVRRTAEAERARLEQAVLRDPVTDLSGPTHIERRLDELQRLSPADQRHYTIAEIELVQYHAIIEHYGLKTAEQALRLFADRIRPMCQPTDVCGRLHDGVFVLIKKHRSDPATVGDLGQRLSDHLATSMPVPFGTLRLSAHVAVRVCAAPPAADPWQEPA